ncbi:hypothetical protein A2U01_0007303, partial [Trifolium medium]|nr:hypothetical protein [Trifolium medium]
MQKHGIATENRGYAGGIVVAWKKDNMNVTLCCKKFQYMHLKVNVMGGCDWYFTPIYASPNEDNRKSLWEDLKLIADSMQEPWMIAGDFNDIVCANEKKNGAPVSLRRCNNFRERINACNLMDLGSVGAKFTWRGPIYHGGQRIYERLDRALSNDKWRIQFPDGFVKVLPRVDFSDHHPLLIETIGTKNNAAPKQFRFESAWLLDESYQDVLKRNWKHDLKVVENLASLQNDFKRWKLFTIDQVIMKKKEIMARLGGIQNSLHNGTQHGGLWQLENKLQTELSEILKKEELMWFQRSRAKWLIDGDRNTRYYHLKTISRRRRNNIVMLKNDQGDWIEDNIQLQELVNNYYKQLFKLNVQDTRWQQTMITFPELNSEEIENLGSEITNDEVKGAVFEMSPWKSPGPDGFPAGFYQQSWDTVGPTVCDFVKEVWKSPSIIATVNQTDICLIPKVDHPEVVSQFRPISLCNTIYKIVSKVIVARLKIYIPKLVSPFQTGFVPGRNIHENIIVAKEMIHSMHMARGRKGYFAIKVDLSKAYDK